VPSPPGGGSILYSTDHGIGVLDVHGVTTHIGGWEAADAFWDPVRPGQILVHPYVGDPSVLLAFQRGDDGWR
jgi:hypothetical protein